MRKKEISPYENLIKMFNGAEIDGVYFSSTVINISFYNSLLIEQNEINSFWLTFDCNAYISDINGNNLVDYLTQDTDFISVLYSLIASEVKIITLENEKLIFTFKDNDKKLVLYEDKDDDSEEIWTIYPTLESSYGEWIVAYYKDVMNGKKTLAIKNL